MAVTESILEKTDPLVAIEISESLGFSVQVSPVASLVAVGVSAAILIWRLKPFGRKSTLELDSAKIGFGKGVLTYKVNDSDFQIAYSIWVELATRKLGIPIDLEHDVISEIYDSWYSFFSVARELIKEVPASKLQNADTQKIVSLLTEVLNQGVRPHLTIWQAKFRHWYEIALKDPKFEGRSPQEIQREFPDYTQLAIDLKAVNQRITYYEQQLRKLTAGISP
jgi:hypothetical protein